MSKVTLPASDTFMPAFTAPLLAVCSLPLSSVNCVCASRSREATAFASAWAALYSLSVMPNDALAALALSPTQVGPSVMPWTSFSYCFSRLLNSPAMSVHLSAALVRQDRSVVMISW